MADVIEQRDAVETPRCKASGLAFLTFMDWFWASDLELRAVRNDLNRS